MGNRLQNNLPTINLRVPKPNFWVCTEDNLLAIPPPIFRKMMTPSLKTPNQFTGFPANWIIRFIQLDPNMLNCLWKCMETISGQKWFELKVLPSHWTEFFPPLTLGSFQPMMAPRTSPGWEMWSVPAWRIIPFSKWLITMVSKSPNWGCSLYKWPKWLINGAY